MRMCIPIHPGDLYVFFANGPGFIVGSFLVFGTYPYAPKLV